MASPNWASPGPTPVFAADKVWISSGARGPGQIEESRQHWNVPRFDLLQVHNLLAWEEHLPTLLAMKAAGQLRYVGITTSEGRRHREFEQIMASQPLDFVQVTYNVLDREVESASCRWRASAASRVIVNRPFREGALIDGARHPLPAWAAEIDCANWAQLLLKFIVSHPAVTCAIPATSQRRARAREHGRGVRPPAGRGDAPAHDRTRREALGSEALMSEWWTYRPRTSCSSRRAPTTDCSSSTTQIWPLQIVALAPA